MSAKIIQTKRRGDKVKKSIYISVEVGAYLDTVGDSISGYIEQLIRADMLNKNSKEE